MRNINDYLNLLAGEHRDKPKFEATVALVTAPLAALQQFLLDLPLAFDLDTAIGAQLDIDGIWIGRSRFIEIPLLSVFFSWDTPNLGWDQGIWFGPFTPGQSLVAFDDATYRALLHTKIIANSWDGTAFSMQRALQLILDPYPNAILGVVDNYDMTMDIGLAGQMPPRLIFALVTGNYVPFKPEGVQLNVHVTSVEGVPLFGLDVETSFISGLDVGAWGVPPAEIGNLPVFIPFNSGSIAGIGSATVTKTFGTLATGALLAGVSGGLAVGTTLTVPTGTIQQGTAAIASIAATAAGLTNLVDAAKAAIAVTGAATARPIWNAKAALIGTGAVAVNVSTARVVSASAAIAGHVTAGVAVTEAPAGTQVVNPGTILLSSTTPGTASANGPFDSWQINVSGQVVKNDVADPTLSAVISLYYNNHFVYASSSNGNASGTPGWWQYIGGANPWSPVATPVAETGEGVIGVYNFGGLPSGGGTTAPVGPAATSNFINVDFNNLTSPSGTNNVTVYPQLFGAATGGMTNNNFGAVSNSTFQSKVRALNLPLLRVGSQFWNGATNPSTLSPLATNISSLIPSTCTLMIGVDMGTSGTQAQYKAVSDYWKANGGIACKYWEIGNEVGGVAESLTAAGPSFNINYQNYYATGAAGIHQTDSTFKVGGPIWAGFDGSTSTTLQPTNQGYPSNYQGGNAINLFIADNTATTLQFLDYHQYLYCDGQTRPTDTQACLAVDPNVLNPTLTKTLPTNVNQFVIMTQQMQALTTSTYASGLPVFLGEYNVECSASFNDVRAGTSIGAAFLVSSMMGLASSSTQPVWGGIWDLMDDAGAGYQLIDSSFNTYPQYYTLQQLIAHMPGTMVNTNSGVTKTGLGTYATPGSGAITDASGNFWYIDTGGNILENGNVIPGGDGTGAIDYFNNTIYGQDSITGNWFTWNGSTFTAAAAPGNLPSGGVQGVQAWATKNGSNICVAIVNGTSSVQSGQIALSHWPVNTTGSSTIHVWTYPTSPNFTTTVQNTPGTLTTANVTSGLTASISVPANSVAIIYTP